ncbi:hypothetical protein JZ751_015472 [Albula glossodonta]|uniref:Terminal nucleotidyltransferase 5B n=1 Tax=Albula glossodonta TaxID=121402 RepID=A0A8T2MX47_9TELE|nr:hypothetical protein JZ751_015472 [Albula glossodonta]
MFWKAQVESPWFSEDARGFIRAVDCGQQSKQALLTVDRMTQVPRWATCLSRDLSALLSGWGCCCHRTGGGVDITGFEDGLCGDCRLHTSRSQQHQQRKVSYAFIGIRIAMSSGVAAERSRRFCVLSWEQVQRLDSILGETVPIHGRGNFPTLSVQPRQIVQVRRRI